MEIIYTGAVGLQPAVAVRPAPSSGWLERTDAHTLRRTGDVCPSTAGAIMPVLGAVKDRDAAGFGAGFAARTSFTGFPPVQGSAQAHPR